MNEKHDKNLTQHQISYSGHSSDLSTGNIKTHVLTKLSSIFFIADMKCRCV